MKKKNSLWLNTLILLGFVLVLTNSCKKDNNDDDNTLPTTGLVIGQSYQGGKIAYILQSGDPGYDANVQHGLIAAPSDQSPCATWGCDGTTMGTSTAIGTGQANTTAIVNGCSQTGIAAQFCNDLVLDGYSDWYLPSKDELNKLYINRTAIGGFVGSHYWSSSEYGGSNAWRQCYNDGIQDSGDGRYYQNYVRAVRTF